MDGFIAHDKANDWNEGTCASTAAAFMDANEESKKKNKGDVAEAHYNAGLAYQRCNNDAEAKKYFTAASAANKELHRARVQVILYDYKEAGDAKLNDTINALQQAVIDAKFQNTEALVNLAALLMKRNKPSPSGEACDKQASDYSCAKLNIQRALAIDDAYMPAFNQLALFYYNQARANAGRADARTIVNSVSKKTKKSGKKEKKIDQQQLELAMLVCSQAMARNSSYAPIYNTAGLIRGELNDFNGAVESFRKASQLDPGFFEAQMNFASMNMTFRGFENAEQAYRGALKMKPNDCDAHLGLALALRGQINDANWDDNVKKAQAELDEVKKLCPDRAETYYNEGILTEEFKAKGSTNEKEKIPVFEKAIEIYNQFVTKAGSAPEYAEAVERATERIRDAKDIIKALQEGVKMAENTTAPEAVEGLESGGDDKDKDKDKDKKDDKPGGGDAPPPAQTPPAQLAELAVNEPRGALRSIPRFRFVRIAPWTEMQAKKRRSRRRPYRVANT
jgi:Tfp pilus assembly protein PilF